MDESELLKLMKRMEKLEQHIEELYLCLQTEPSLRINYEKMKNVIDQTIDNKYMPATKKLS